MNLVKKSAVAMAAAGLGLSVLGLSAAPADAGTSTSRTGHFDVEAVVTCTPGTDTVTDVEAEVHWDGAPPAYNDATDYIDFGGNDSLSETSNDIGVHPEYDGCLTDPDVTFTLTAASVTTAAGTPKNGYAYAYLPGGSLRYASYNTTPYNGSKLVVDEHTDFGEMTYNTFGTGAGFFKWTFQAAVGGQSDSASFTVKAN